MAQSPPTSEENAAAERPAVVHCIVVAPGGEAGVPADLRESLGKRCAGIEVHGTVFGAMAAAARLRAADASSRKGAPTALLVVSPDEVPRAEELVAAIEKYVPRIVRWRYDATATPRLRGFILKREDGEIVREDRSNPREAGAYEASRAGVAFSGEGRLPARPALRLAGLDDSEFEAAMAAPEAQAPRKPSALLTDEEIAMLLSDEEPGPSGERADGS